MNFFITHRITMSKDIAGTIRLNLRLDKISKKEGKAPVELIYSLHGKRQRVSTGIKVYPVSWDAAKTNIIYLNKAEAKKLCPEIPYNSLPSESEVEHLNAGLVLKKNDIVRAENQIGENIQFNSTMIASAVRINNTKKAKTKKEEPQTYLVDFIDHLVEGSRASRNAGTIKVYVTTRNHIAAYQKAKRVRVTLEEANYGFLQGFYNYLITDVNQINVTAAKQVTTVKTFLSFARKHGYKVNQTYHDFNVKREVLEVIALTEIEFLTLYNLDLSDHASFLQVKKSENGKDFISKLGYKTLDKVRDILCFSCVTGLRYSDLAQLRKEHIKGSEIQLTVTKTREIIKVPLNQYSRTILDKYRLNLRPLPMISNQKLNQYIKELCKLAGIDDAVQIVRYRGATRIENTYPKYELISAHTGRKTFATLSLEKGANAEEVMSMTGHKSYNSFKRYVKITEERKKLVMAKAWGSPEVLKVVEGGEG
jgi:integrase